MVFDISVKIREIGSVQGTFLKATKNSIYMKDVLLNRTSATKVSLFKIDRRYVVSVDRGSSPAFETFTNEELRVALRNSPRYADHIKNVQAARNGRQADSPSARSDGSSHSADTERNAQDSKTASDKKGAATKKGKKGGEWDQFEANSKLFGVSPKFDINEYTSPIDTKSRSYKSDFEKSAKIANEIMNQKTTDTHRLEERGAVKNGDGSDEGLFSTVKDSSKWSRKAAPQSANGTVKEEDNPGNVITVLSGAKASGEATMEEELIKKKKEVISETNNENPDSQKMWASLKQFLSLKKKVEDTANPVFPVEPSPVEKVTSPPSSPEGKSSPVHSEHGRDKRRHTDEAGVRAHRNYNGQHKEEKGDRDSGRSSKSKDSFPRQGYRSFRKQDDSPDLKTQKQVIIGCVLRHKSADELVNHFISNFSSSSPSAFPRESWGTGCTIEDKIDYIKNKQMYIMPSVQRLSEIFVFGLYRSKK